MTPVQLARSFSANLLSNQPAACAVLCGCPSVGAGLGNSPGKLDEIPLSPIVYLVLLPLNGSTDKQAPLCAKLIIGMARIESYFQKVLLK